MVRECRLIMLKNTKNKHILLGIFLIFASLYLISCDGSQEEEIPQEEPDEEVVEIDSIRFDNETHTVYDLSSSVIPDIVRVADIDSDGDLDVVFSVMWNGISSIKNDSEGEFSHLFELPMPKSGIMVTDFRIVDLNGDNFLDVVAVYENKLVTWSGSSTGFSGPNEIVSIFGEIRSFAIGDYNNDGSDDVLLGFSFVTEVLLDWDPDNTIRIGRGADLMEFASVSGPNSNDLIMQYVNHYVNDYELNFSASLHDPQLGLGDLNYDGIDDIVTNRGSRSLVWLDYANAPDSPQTLFSDEENDTRAVQVADFDEDGDNDIIFGHWLRSPEFNFFINNGDGTFKPQRALIGAVASDKSMASGDINGDGKIDIIYANASVKRILWKEN